MPTTNIDEAKRLLGELNRVEREFGVHRITDPNVDPSGEVVGRERVLEQRIAELGYTTEWNGQEFVMRGPDGRVVP